MTKNISPELVHSIQGIATKGVGAAGQTIKTVAVNKAHSLIDKGAKRAEDLGVKLINKGSDKGRQLIDQGTARIEELTPSTSVVPQKRKRVKTSNSKNKTKNKPVKRQKLSNILDEA